MGEHDAPTQVDFVRHHTDTDLITYIGFSMGTTQMFYQLATNEKFWKKRLNAFVAVAPVI